MIEKGGSRINALIEQVHVLASAKEYLSNEPVPIRRALELSLTHLETYIEEQGLSLTLQIDADATSATWVSPEGLALIVEKLIQNASQALNDQQERSLRIGLVGNSDESTALGLALYVSDNGPGSAMRWQRRSLNPLCRATQPSRRVAWDWLSCVRLRPLQMGR